MTSLGVTPTTTKPTPTYEQKPITQVVGETALMGFTATAEAMVEIILWLEEE